MHGWARPTEWVGLALMGIGLCFELSAVSGPGMSSTPGKIGVVTGAIGLLVKVVGFVGRPPRGNPAAERGPSA